jgi:hypothetical protein
MILISDIQYFPSIIFYKISYNFRHIVFEQYESYQKMSFRNRCQVMGSQGMVELSIPLAGGRGQKTLMKDVRIDTGQNWQAQHWKTIFTCYNRSPWFGFYQDELEALYRRPAEFLMDWDLACLEWTMGVLGWRGTISRTEAYREVFTAEDGVVDWRGRLLPRNRQEWGEGPGDMAWGIGVAAGMAAGAAAGQAPERYHQVFGDRTGFIPNLSILDLLFCEGREAVRYLRPAVL